MLLIEDNEVVRSVIRRMLLGSEYEVIEAETTRSGLDKAWSVHADLVLGDVSLGMRDGIGVMAAIRRARPGIPLIVVSGCAQEEVWARLGAEGLRESVWSLSKPFTQGDLLAALARALAPPT